MKPIINKKDFDMLVNLCSITQVVSIEEAREHIKSMYEQYPDYLPEKPTFIPNRSDRRKKNHGHKG
jgi:uncharacterized protein YeeX (DUF496 family)